MDDHGVDPPVDQRPHVGAGPPRVVCRAVAARAAPRGPGARAARARRARGVALVRPAGAHGAAHPRRASGLPAARRLRVRVRGHRRDHRADRGELAAARDAGAQAPRGGPAAVRPRRSRARRLAGAVPRGRRGGRPGGPRGAARQGRGPLRRPRRQGDGPPGPDLRRRGHRALHGGGGRPGAVRRPPATSEATAVRVNGQPGPRGARAGRARRASPRPRSAGIEVWSVLTVDVVDGRIQAVRIVRNPDKLGHV